MKNTQGSRYWTNRKRK